MFYLLLYLFGFLPSIIWLLFYLRKDKHPEPNSMVLKVFIFGMGSAYLAILLQLALKEVVEGFTNSVVLILALNMFIGAGLLEESSKYLAAKTGAFYNKALDEPLDLALYMIIAALGFAAVENILYLNSQVLNPENMAILSQYHALMPARAALEFLGWRFISATFLHALASGFFGYFLALSFYHLKKRWLLVSVGLGGAALFHGLYNWSIMSASRPWNLLIPLSLLIFLSCFVSYGFTKLKTLKTICQQ